ncbi:MAG TPA: hypothetical protein VI318_19785, partial [Baekduia sp.]
AGAAPLTITGVDTAGDAPDDFLVTSDGCTGTTLASGGGATCTVRLRFAPSAAGARAATLRIHDAGGGTYALPIAGTGTADTSTTTTQASTTLDADSTSSTSTSTSTTPAAAVPNPAPAAPAATNNPNLQPQPKKKTARLILTLSLRKITSTSGRPVTVGFALGRAASVVLRVKHGGRTVEIRRAAEREGRGSLKWDGRLGRHAAPKGTYRIDVYAVAADGRAARASVALTVK